MRQLEYSSRPFITSLARLVYERTRALQQRWAVPRGTSPSTTPPTAAGGASDRRPWRERRFVDITIMVTIGFAVYMLAAWRLLP